MTSVVAASAVTPRAVYRTLSIAETVTWSLLIAGMVLKYGFDVAIAVTIAGSIHGFVFIAYAATAVLTGVNQRWRARLVLLAVATAVVPFATIPFDRWLEKRDLLDGGWRTQRTDDPRDSSWFDAIVRWMLRRPWLLAAIMIVGAVAVFTALIVAGPPGGGE